MLKHFSEKLEALLLENLQHQGSLQPVAHLLSSHLAACMRKLYVMLKKTLSTVRDEQKMKLCKHRHLNFWFGSTCTNRDNRPLTSPKNDVVAVGSHG
jgi:hypothetical protein